MARNDTEETMVKLRKPKSKMTSAIIVNYDLFKMMYNIDFRRDLPKENMELEQSDEDNRPF